MLNNRYSNSNFGSSEGAKIQNFVRAVSLDPMTDSTSLHIIIQASHKSFEKRDVKKGGSDIKWDQLWH